MKILDKKQGIVENLLKLNIGETFSFEIHRTMSVRQTIAQLRLKNESRFTTSTNLEDKTITVTRIN